MKKKNKKKKANIILSRISGSSKEEFEIRLVKEDGVSTTSGRLEIFTDGMWGTVCDDNIENSEAQDITGDVICRQLGHNEGGMVSRNIWRHHPGYTMVQNCEIRAFIS